MTALTPAQVLFADLLAKGIELETNGDGIRWRPSFLLNAKTVARILEHKVEIIALIQQGYSPPRCPKCEKVLDSKARCTECWDRICADCGQWTGTAFVARCWPCSFRWCRGNVAFF